MADIVCNDSSINDIEDDCTTLDPNLQTSVSATVRFWILVFLEIPSIFCSILLLYNLYFDRTLRKVLNNHVIIVILIVGLFSQATDISNYLTYVRLGYIWPQTIVNCYIWWFVGATAYSLLGMLMAWTTIERHIIIFHHQWLNTRKKRIFIHYIPLISIILYACIFYIVCVFFVSCDNTPDYTQYWCYGPCYLGVFGPNIFDTFVNVIRVIKQKQRLRQQIHWHKYRRMIIQVLSCSLLYLLFNFPLMSMYLTLIFGVPYGSTGEFEVFVYFFCYFIPVLMPFVCLASSKEIWIKIKKIVTTKRTINRVAPQALQLNK
ncbi:unnamed protein product [Adineta steineri]|uniref:Uncharacterized protein n=1 Tax=Adineta steineri TaxID=433720 RepID=A0A814K8Z9_9BILA|nr:unnamed protein product [Adineta steineri]CAF1141820.1 unnamed protein product [Adineta steineri]